MSVTSSTGSAAPKLPGREATPTRCVANSTAPLAERLVHYVHGGTYAGLLDGPTTVRRMHCWKSSTSRASPTGSSRSPCCP